MTAIINTRRFDGRLLGRPTEATLYLIGGKWKGVILHHLLIDGTQRFGALQRKLAGVTQRMLVKQLRELEQGGLVRREIFPQVPVRVEYSLTDLGHSLEPILVALDQWGKNWLKIAPSERVRRERTSTDRFEHRDAAPRQVASRPSRIP